MIDEDWLEKCRQEYNAAGQRFHAARAELELAVSVLVDAAERYGRAAGAKAVRGLAE